MTKPRITQAGLTQALSSSKAASPSPPETHLTWSRPRSTNRSLLSTCLEGLRRSNRALSPSSDKAQGRFPRVPRAAPCVMAWSRTDSPFSSQLPRTRSATRTQLSTSRTQFYARSRSRKTLQSRVTTFRAKFTR
jgi:hypothetical protein